MGGGWPGMGGYPRTGPLPAAPPAVDPYQLVPGLLVREPGPVFSGGSERLGS
jgi:hypothetical protein